MTPTCHLWHQHGTYDTSMSPMAPAYNLWNHDDTHVTYDTDMASMTHCPGAGKGRFWCKTMAQYGTVCNICHPHLTMTYMLCHPWHHDGTHVTYDTDMESMTLSWQQWHHTVLELGKDNTCDLGDKQWHNMAQYVIYVIPTSPWRTCYVTHDTTMAPMSPMTQTWNQWHYHGNNDTTCTVLELGKDDSGVKQWHNMAQYVIYVIPTSPWRTCYVTHDTTMAPMSPMTQTWNQWHHHGNNDTTLSWAGKGRFWCKTMAQYGTVCNICHPHLTMTYMLCHPWHHDGTHVTYDTDMESMTLSWQQWHHTVLELGKDDSGVKQWHNMAQYVIYVIPTSPWRTCYVTHDTTMAPMSPMTQTWNQWHYHGNNDTTLSWSWERTILV